MLLERLSLRGFRCYADVQSIPFHRLTVFIGENDSGKTCVLDALVLLLTANVPAHDDYHKRATGETADVIEIRGEFDLEPHDSLPHDLRTAGGTRLHLAKRYTAAATEVLIEGRGYSEPRWTNFPKEGADAQKELLQTLGLAPGPNKDARLEQFRQAVADDRIPKIETRLAVPFLDLRDHLPRFERVASAEYNNPEAMVQRTLRAVVETVLQTVDP